MYLNELGIPTMISRAKWHRLSSEVNQRELFQEKTDRMLNVLSKYTLV